MQAVWAREITHMGASCSTHAIAQASIDAVGLFQPCFFRQHASAQGGRGQSRLACSPRYRTPFLSSSSNVSPRMGLNGFQARSTAPQGAIVKPTTHASLQSTEQTGHPHTGTDIGSEDNRLILEMMPVEGFTGHSYCREFHSTQDIVVRHQFQELAGIDCLERTVLHCLE